MRTAARPPSSTYAELEADLRRGLAGEVRFDDLTRRIYSTDASMYQIEPIGVVFPRQRDDLVAAVELARAHGVAVLPRGGATSLAGQAVGHALILDCAKYLNRIGPLNAEEKTVVVQPGVVQDQLNRAVRGQGLVFGPDTSTASRATLGGMIGNNSGGTHSVVYGMTIEHVRSLEVVLSDGSTAHLAPLDAAAVAERAGRQSLEGRLYRELPRLLETHAASIATRFPPYWRRSGGYRLERAATAGGGLDLAKLVVGSEGTLVVVSEATVALVDRPKVTAIAVGQFRSTAAAIEATEDALSLSPIAVELLDHTILDLARRQRELAPVTAVLDGEPEALLYVTFAGESEAEARAGVERCAELFAKHHHGYATLRAVTAAEQAPLLKVRGSALGLLMASASGPKRPLAFVEDTAVDPEHLADYAAAFEALLARRGVRAGFYGHCSVGCLHVRPFVDLTDPAEVATMRAIAEEVLELNARFGGSNSSEHGDGLVRSEFNRRIYGDDLYEAMRELKGLFDPENRMNPGKIVDGPSMTDNLRDPALRRDAPVRTRLKLLHGSMFESADRCMRIGACRKSGEGTMCPSYMATLEEEHSTRGRASALVAALSSPDPLGALADDRLHEALDLCLECKACKSECPLNVDMAALKAETLARYHDVHGVDRRSRAFALVPALNRLGSLAAPLTNAALGSKAVRALLERFVGVDRRRPLPRLARQDLGTWYRRRRLPAPPAGATRVIVLADSFTSYAEPEIGRAAIELLSAAGYAVEITEGLCCGRPKISKGLLDEARRDAARLAHRLGPAARAGARIVGWEPSCILTLGDEHPALLGGDPDAAAVAGASSFVDQLLLDAIADGRLALSEHSALAGRHVVLHGHCHQKSLTGTASTRALLAAIPGVTVSEIDSGCCGMAGSFGYETEHYELSMRIGEDRLFPAVREAPADAVIAATGTSCRQQIAHGTGRAARHPLELLAMALPDRA